VLCFMCPHLYSWPGRPWSAGPLGLGSSSVSQPSLETATTSKSARRVVWKTPALSESTSIAVSASQLDIADNAALQLTRHADATVQWRSGITPADAQDVRLLEQVSLTIDKRKIEHSVNLARMQLSGDELAMRGLLTACWHLVVYFCRKVTF
jgi:hypothetical protein